MDKHNAQEVHEPTGAPEVLELTAAALRRDLRALDILARALELPADEQQAAFIDGLTEYAQEVQDRTDGEQLAFSLPDYNAALDPAGGAFDPAAYRQAIDDAGGWQVFKKELKSREDLRDVYGKYKEIGKAAAEAIKNSPAIKAAGELSKSPGLRAATELTRQQAATLQKALRAFWDSPEMQKNRERLAEAIEKINAIAEVQRAKAAAQWTEYADAPEHIQEIAVYIQAELSDAEAEGLDLEGATLAGIMAASFDSEWKPIETSPYYERVVLNAIERAQERAESQQLAEALAQSEETPDTEAITAELVRGEPLNNILFPLDKPNKTIWTKEGTAGQIPGQMSFSFDVSAKDAEKKDIVIFTVDYNAMKDAGLVPENVNSFDFDVANIMGSYFEAGQTAVSPGMVYDAMGGKGKMGKTDRENIIASYRKMIITPVKYAHFREVETKKGTVKTGYEGPFVIGHIEPIYLNGHYIEDGLIIHEMPGHLVEARKQITRVNKVYFKIKGVNMSERNRRIRNYILREIKHMKNQPNFSRKMLYSTIFEECGIIERKQQDRAKITIRKILDDYKKEKTINGNPEKLIKGYTEGPDGVKIKI